MAFFAVIALHLRYPSDYGAGTALFGQLVFANSAGTKVVSIDATAALAMPGVHAFVVATDVPGMNACNAAIGGNQKEKIFYGTCLQWRVTPSV
jgi:xanthine dehydrogenase molybdopterin-binding subunit B